MLPAPGEPARATQSGITRHGKRHKDPVFLSELGINEKVSLLA